LRRPVSDNATIFLGCIDERRGRHDARGLGAIGGLVEPASGLDDRADQRRVRLVVASRPIGRDAEHLLGMVVPHLAARRGNAAHAEIDRAVVPRLADAEAVDAPRREVVDHQRGGTKISRISSSGSMPPAASQVRSR
jgi:hypothetical protein